MFVFFSLNSYFYLFVYIYTVKQYIRELLDNLLTALVLSCSCLGLLYKKAAGRKQRTQALGFYLERLWILPDDHLLTITDHRATSSGERYVDIEHY